MANPDCTGTALPWAARRIDSATEELIPPLRFSEGVAGCVPLADGRGLMPARGQDTLRDTLNELNPDTTNAIFHGKNC